jgi:hypothetical protein
MKTAPTVFFLLGTLNAAACDSGPPPSSAPLAPVAVERVAKAIYPVNPICPDCWLQRGLGRVDIGMAPALLTGPRPANWMVLRTDQGTFNIAYPYEGELRPTLPARFWASLPFAAPPRTAAVTFAIDLGPTLLYLTDEVEIPVVD